MISELHTQRGFTLIESLVYIALFVIVSTAAFIALMHYYALFQQYQVRQALFHTGTSAMERVLLEVREAEDIDQDQSVWTANHGHLIVTVDGEQREVVLVDGVLELRTPEATTSLNDERVRIDTFTLYPYTSGGITLVRVRIQATSQRDTYQESWEWESAAVARGTYSE